MGFSKPLTRRLVFPPPSPPVLREEAHSLAREGLGESQFRRGDIHCGTFYIYVFCGWVTFFEIKKFFGRLPVLERRRDRSGWAGGRWSAARPASSCPRVPPAAGWACLARSPPRAAGTFRGSCVAPSSAGTRSPYSKNLNYLSILCWLVGLGSCVAQLSSGTRSPYTGKNCELIGGSRRRRKIYLSTAAIHKLAILDIILSVTNPNNNWH